MTECLIYFKCTTYFQYVFSGIREQIKMNKTQVYFKLISIHFSLFAADNLIYIFFCNIEAFYL